MDKETVAKVHFSTAKTGYEDKLSSTNRIKGIFRIIIFFCLKQRLQEHETCQKFT